MQRPWHLLAPAAAATPQSVIDEEEEAVEGEAACVRRPGTQARQTTKQTQRVDAALETA